jgi:hypothetical protein
MKHKYHTSAAAKQKTTRSTWNAGTNQSLELGFAFFVQTPEPLLDPHNVDEFHGGRHFVRCYMEKDHRGQWHSHGAGHVHSRQ